MSSKPSIFIPFNLRGGQKYRSLKNHIFTVVEKVWICKSVMNFFDISDNEKEYKIKCFCDRYNVEIYVIDDWIESYLNGDILVSSLPIFQCPMDRIGIQVIQDCISVGRNVDETEEEFKTRFCDLMKEELSNTSNRRA